MFGVVWFVVVWACVFRCLGTFASLWVCLCVCLFVGLCGCVSVGLCVFGFAGF